MALKGGNISLWEWDLETNTVYLSPEWKHQLGYQDHELANRYETWEQLLHRDDRDCTLDTLKSCLQWRRADCILEYRLRHKDGSYRWMHGRASLRSGSDGKPCRLWAWQLDLKKRKRAEAEHTQLLITDQAGYPGPDTVKQQLGNVLERVSDGVIALDRDWRYTYVNQQAATLFGRTPEDLVGRYIWTEFPEGSGQPFHLAYEKAMAEQVFVQMENYYEPWDRWFENRIYPSQNGLSIFFHEITDRKRAEQAADQSAELIKGQNQVLELIARSAPLQQTLDLLLRVIEAQCPGMLCSILLLDRAGLHLRHGAAPSLPETFTDAIDGAIIGPRAGSCGTAAFRGETIIVEDIATDSLWDGYRDLALKHGLCACWSTPIFDEQGRVLGTFALYFRTHGRPTHSHHKLIEVATYIAAVAIVRHRETQALRTSEERLRLAVTGGNIGIWEWDVGTDCIVLSDELKAIFGWPTELEDDLTLRMFMDAIHPEDRLRIEAALQCSLAEHTNYEVEFRTLLPDGPLRWIAAKGRGEYNAAGKPVRMFGVALDITDRKRAEQEINRREAQLVMAQRIAHLGSYDWDISTNSVYRSEELCRIFGIRSDQFEPTFEGYLERVHPEDRDITRRIIEQAYRSCEPFDFEERIVRPDGEIRVLQSQGQWSFEQGSPVKLIGICHDITERKRVEQQLRAANVALSDELKERTRAEKEVHALSARLINAQEEERTRVARELHDDLSQQIASLSIVTSNLRKGIPSECADVRAQSERIQKKLIHLAESIRRLSHELHPAILQHSGLSAALRTYSSEFGALTGIRVCFQAEGAFEAVPAPVALCIYRVVQEALQNIARHARVAEAAVALRRSRGILYLTVSDQGIGMDLNRAGSAPGLGLVSIRERTRLVNGSIGIESQPNKGTTLIVTVPVSG
jgi:PAS domain S-box-containing protein